MPAPSIGLSWRRGVLLDGLVEGVQWSIRLNVAEEFPAEASRDAARIAFKLNQATQCISFQRDVH
jgi:hypothetical protein